MNLSSEFEGGGGFRKGFRPEKRKMAEFAKSASIFLRYAGGTATALR